MSLTSLNRRDFLRTTSLTTGGLALGTIPTRSAPAPNEVPANRLARLATGANVCRWFRFPRRESNEHFQGYIPESEANLMAQMGLKHVRLCVAPKILMEVSTGAIHEDRAIYLEAAIQRFHAAGLLVMVDMHNEDRKDELDTAWQEAFVRFWSALAGRLSKFDPEMTMLEIINEPVFSKREGEWNVLNGKLASAIRKSAPQHTIVTSGANWGGIDGLRKLTLLGDQNVVYSFHCYDPFTFTHQGATWSSDAVKPLRNVPYPSSPEAVADLLPGLESQPASRKMVEAYGRERWGKEKLLARFRQGIDWGVTNKVPLYCGEFGVYPPHSKPEHRANWFRDFGQVLASNHIGWAVWGWDEGFGLNRRIVDGKPVVDPVVGKALGLKV